MTTSRLIYETLPTNGAHAFDGGQGVAEMVHRNGLEEMIVDVLGKLLEGLADAPHDSLKSLMEATGVGEMSGTDLSDVDLQGQDLSSIQFVGTDFTGADLRGCSFVESDLRHACFARARLAGAQFFLAAVADADFRDAIGLSEWEAANLEQKGARVARMQEVEARPAAASEAAQIIADPSLERDDPTSVFE